MTIALALAGADVGVAGESRKALRANANPTKSSLGTAAIDVDFEPLPASPVTGSLAPTSDDDDVFALNLDAGDRFTMQVTAAAPSADIDVYLLWPEAETLAPPYAGSAYATGQTESLVFDAPVSGTYYLDLYCAGDATDYALTYSVTAAANANGFGRIAGRNRYATALAISSSAFANGSTEDVVIATGTDYPDAMSAGALAGALGCPLLLTDRLTLSPGIADEIERLGVRTAHIVGGPIAISDGVRTQLEDLGITVERFSGANRYAVSAEIAAAVKELKPSAGKDVFLASGQLFPDSLSVSPYAYRMVYPTLLTRRDLLEPAALAAMDHLGTTRVFIAGGPNAVSTTVENQLKARGLTVVRLAGQNRYATAHVVADYAIAQHWGDPTRVAVASGLTFPDALAGGAAYGAQGGVMVLTTRDRLDAQANSFVDSWSDLGLIDDTRILGGTLAVGADAATALRTVVTR